MGIFDFLKSKSGNKKFVSEADFTTNLANQIKMAPQTLQQLRELGVSEDKELKLEYFFYTNSLDKAEQLADGIKDNNSSTEFREATLGNSQFVITGWTHPMRMSNDVVSNWTKEMCEVGYKYDCEFDGWGTDPNQ